MEKAAFLTRRNWVVANSLLYVCAWMCAMRCNAMAQGVWAWHSIYIYIYTAKFFVSSKNCVHYAYRTSLLLRSGCDDIIGGWLCSFEVWKLLNLYSWAQIIVMCTAAIFHFAFWLYFSFSLVSSTTCVFYSEKFLHLYMEHLSEHIYIYIYAYIIFAILECYVTVNTAAIYRYSVIYACIPRKVVVFKLEDIFFFYINYYYY